MAIVIQPYTAHWVPAVKAFNQRLAAGGIGREFQFPESEVPYWLPKVDGRRIYQDFFLATDGEFVRGAFILKHQDFSIRGEMQPLIYYHLPVSEGIVSKKYAGIGVHMLRSAMKMQPKLFALGMGGFDRPLPAMLSAMGWSLCAVPFHFKVAHPGRFLRNIAALRRNPGRRLLADLAALSGVGRVAIHTLQFLSHRPIAREIRVEEVTSFGPWADDLWETHRNRYLIIGSRESSTLNVLYPSGKGFICLKVSRGTKVLGWIVLLHTQMKNNNYFGDMRLGSIVDCFAAPENAGATLQAGTQALERRGVDLIVSNQGHKAWSAGLRSIGFLSASSNFIFAASQPVAALISPFESNKSDFFLNRGDGDGPVNL